MQLGTTLLVLFNPGLVCLLVHLSLSAYLNKGRLDVIEPIQIDSASPLFGCYFKLPFPFHGSKALGEVGPINAALSVCVCMWVRVLTQQQGSLYTHTHTSTAPPYRCDLCLILGWSVCIKGCYPPALNLSLVKYHSQSPTPTFLPLFLPSSLITIAHIMSEQKTEYLHEKEFVDEKFDIERSSINLEEEENSPIPEVAAIVSNKDDPSIPVMTFRYYVMAVVFSLILSFFNQFL